ncbi:YceI family protein [Aliikangiella sp. IMCC44359]|uniref:YceI family protein n=1 Tax=Aliikangiella sp. IMCC44359 TaxID=3459125 RepID=UPI00403ADB91
MKKILTALVASAALSLSVSAADYTVDTRGAHASVNFKIKHLGYSWLTGRFNKFSGEFSYDAKKVADSKIAINIDTTSIDSNHAERDKHLKSSDYLDVSKFGTAKFVSKKVTDKGNDQLAITGDLTLHGVTKSITIDAEKIGEGKDPWGGYRVGFSGTTVLTLKDFGIPNVGSSSEVLMDLQIEGIRKK